MINMKLWVVAQQGYWNWLLEAFNNAKITKGSSSVYELIKVKEIIKDADLILTGEGATNYQTLFGKAPIQIAKLDKKYKVLTIIISGQVDGDLTDFYDFSVIAIHSIMYKIYDSKRMYYENTCNSLIKATEAIVRTRYL